MKLTPKEEKITRLALDRAAKDGERAAAALKLIESLRARGVTVEDLQADAAPEIVYVEPEDRRQQAAQEPAYYRTPTAEERAAAQAQYDEEMRVSREKQAFQKQQQDEIEAETYARSQDHWLEKLLRWNAIVTCKWNGVNPTKANIEATNAIQKVVFSICAVLIIVALIILLFSGLSQTAQG
jgi:hypothetical protein